MSRKSAPQARSQPAGRSETPHSAPTGEGRRHAPGAGPARSTEEVIRDHLREGKHGDVERDLPRNYAPDLVVLTAAGQVHGWDGMRRMARKLREELPQASFTYEATTVAGRFALLEWTGRSRSGAYVDDGVDSYVVEDGRIIAQTIHYTVRQGGDA